MAKENNTKPMAKEKKVTIFLPLIKGDKTKEVFVGVNGKGYKIKRGMNVEVPESVAEVIRNSEQQEYKAAQLIEASEDKN